MVLDRRAEGADARSARAGDRPSEAEVRAKEGAYPEEGEKASTGEEKARRGATSHAGEALAVAECPSDRLDEFHGRLENVQLDTLAVDAVLEGALPLQDDLRRHKHCRGQAVAHTLHVLLYNSHGLQAGVNHLNLVHIYLYSLSMASLPLHNKGQYQFFLLLFQTSQGIQGQEHFLMYPPMFLL